MNLGGGFRSQAGILISSEKAWWVSPECHNSPVCPNQRWTTHWVSRKQSLVCRGTAAGGQAYRCAEGMGITGESERLRVVSVYVQGCQGKVHTMPGWCCQVAEGGYVLGMWLRNISRDVLTLMLVTECATTGSSKRGSSLCRIPLVLSGQKG